MLTYHGIAKKALGFLPLKGLRYHIDLLTEHISLAVLFHIIPKVSCRHHETKCSCGQKLEVLKTYPKKMVTFEVGELSTHITELQCVVFGKVYSPGELEKLVPCGSRFGCDVIEYVGRALFLECLSEKQIQYQQKKFLFQIVKSDIWEKVYHPLGTDAQGKSRNIHHIQGGYSYESVQPL